jgi:hypothetical protein
LDHDRDDRRVVEMVRTDNFEKNIWRGNLNENRVWRIRTNQELRVLTRSQITEIKTGRLRWAGHVQRREARRKKMKRQAKENMGG